MQGVQLDQVGAGTSRASTRSSQNQDTAYALNYHESTKHSEISLRTSGHYLDWADKPSQFKIYEGLTSISDRKSTRLNSSHSQISYAVFCLKKKKNRDKQQHNPGFTHGMQVGARICIYVGLYSPTIGSLVNVRRSFADVPIGVSGVEQCMIH